MEQLHYLKDIFEQGFITLEEFETRKRQIIDKLTNTTAQPLHCSSGPPLPDFLPQEEEPMQGGDLNLIEPTTLELEDLRMEDLFPQELVPTSPQNR